LTVYVFVGTFKVSLKEKAADIRKLGRETETLDSRDQWY